MLFNEQFLTEMLGAQVLSGKLKPGLNFCVDSRLCKEGDLFVALQGNNIDGHSFLNDAIDAGASGLILAKNKKNIFDKIDAKRTKNLFVMLVDNPYDALITMARVWRQQFNCPVVGITGSVGKTSTCELISRMFNMNNISHLVTQENQNSQLGAALTLLRMRPEHEVAIIEMGVNHRGEMDRLASLVQPTIGLITAIGHSHMEGLGSISDIAAEKRDIFKYFKEDYIGVINGDQQELTRVAYRHPVVKVGQKTTNQIQARKIRLINNRIHCVLKLYGKKHSIIIPTNHHGIISNALSAAAVAHLLNIPNEIVIKAIQEPFVVAGRFEEKSLKGGTGIIISDCYNANPESMKAALLALQERSTSGKKIAVLGDMVELGANGPFWHRQLGRFLRKIPSLDHLVLVGDMMEWTKSTLPIGLSVEHVPTWQSAVSLLEKKLDAETVVLVKGSNKIGLDNLVSKFAQKQ